MKKEIIFGSAGWLVDNIWVGRMAWSSCLQKGNPVGTAVGDSDGEQLAHCDVGFMVRAQVGNALEVDVGAVLGAALGIQDGW